MHIAIEGLDGVGKSSTARVLAERLGFQFVEKPMKYFTDSDGTMCNYSRFKDWLNNGPSKDLRAWFYGCGCILTNILYSDINIITDRYLISDYYWNGDETNEDAFAALVHAARIPDFTFILRSSVEKRRIRLMERDHNDDDLIKTGDTDKSYAKMTRFAEKYNMPYTVVDNSQMDLVQTADYFEQLLLTNNKLPLKR